MFLLLLMLSRVLVAATYELISHSRSHSRDLAANTYVYMRIIKTAVEFGAQISLPVLFQGPLTSNPIWSQRFSTISKLFSPSWKTRESISCGARPTAVNHWFRCTAPICCRKFSTHRVSRPNLSAMICSTIGSAKVFCQGTNRRLASAARSHEEAWYCLTSWRRLTHNFSDKPSNQWSALKSTSNAHFRVRCTCICRETRNYFSSFFFYLFCLSGTTVNYFSLFLY